MSRIRRLLLGVCIALAIGVSAAVRSSGAQDAGAKVDAVFARWNETTPGCAVGVASGGTPVLTRGYGMADLEHDIRNTADTIFEAGSVSKQFTAAAVLLLARDGKLSLDDPVRKYIPELPDYGTPLTIRHMLTHTSGLRDWGSVAGISGWPRGRRVHTHAHVLEIVARQRALNFTPGTRHSYSNTGYNLSAILVSRVSGMSFAEFSRRRIFEPLGMTRTSWRDDFTRIVKDRATAYAGGDDGYRINMPYENVHGNGGLLTTVGDLLRWNENFVTPKIGDAAFVREQQTPGRFTSGREHQYAAGLYVRPYKGVAEVSHSGSTAGYRAFLTRFPDQHLSVAVLCNAGNANATQFAHAVADLYLGAALKPDGGRPAAIAEARGPLADLKRDDSYRPSAAQLAEFAGVYTSDEAETTLTVEVDGNELVIERRPDTTIQLRPHSADRFDARSLGHVRFHRNGGRVTELGITQDRVWDLRFTRQAASSSTR